MQFDKASPVMSKQSTGKNIPREPVNLTLHKATTVKSASSTGAMYYENYVMCTHSNTN